MSWVWLNGALVRESGALVPATDRGLLFGRGVFESFRARPGRPVYRLREHMARLSAGADALAIDQPLTEADVTGAVAALVERCELDDARVRLTVTAGPEGGRPSALIQARAATDSTPEMYEKGIGLVLASVRRNETSPLCRFKTLAILDNVLAREEARAAGAADALLLNTRGLVAEAAMSNVFVVRKGRVMTPPVEDGALPGVTRAAVLELARAAGVAADEASFTLDELQAADEVFVTNAVAGVLPVTVLEGAPIGAGVPGEVSRRLGDALWRDMGYPVPASATG
jgi:branched-subunit amino acid aminotransferase/4-amino-4-deoxychorismate lyase